MLIPIKRYYKNSGITCEIMINTLYIIKIEDNEGEYPNTRIVMDSIRMDGPDVIYTDETFAVLKKKMKGK